MWNIACSIAEPFPVYICFCVHIYVYVYIFVFCIFVFCNCFYILFLHLTQLSLYGNSIFANVICLLFVSLFQQLIKILSRIDEFCCAVGPRSLKLMPFCQLALLRGMVFFWTTLLIYWSNSGLPRVPRSIACKIVLWFLFAHVELRIDSVSLALLSSHKLYPCAAVLILSGIDLLCAVAGLTH